MRRPVLAFLLAALAVCAGSLLPALSYAAPAAAPELVHFASLDHWQSEQALQLDGYLFRPAAASGDNAAAYPVVVMFHGCGGAFNKEGMIAAHLLYVAHWLQHQGYGVLLVDSFQPRGVREICTTPPRQRRILAQQRWLDAYGALDYLHTRSDVLSSKIGAIGFSHGGSTALEVMDAGLPPYRASGHGFAAAVAMYPGCYESLRQAPAFKAYGPVLIQSGELDDWTPATYCRQLSEHSRAAGEPVEFISYSGAYHGFDTTAELRVRKDVTHGVNGIGGVHYGGDPAAREQAYQKIAAFFAAHLRP